MKKLLIMIAVVFLTASCLDNTVPLDGIDGSPNLVGFKSASKLAAVATDDLTHDTTVPVLITGPQFQNYNKDVTVTISVDPSSTAVEGVNFTLPSNTMVLGPSNNFSGLFPITILTQGISSPSDVTLVLNIDNASESDILVNGRLNKVAVKIQYLCFSALDLGHPYSNPDCVGNQATVTEISAGTYEVGDLPYLSAGGNPIPFEMTDVCGDLTIDTIVLGAYLVRGEGVVNADGSFTITYQLFNSTTPDSGVFFDFSNDPSTYMP